MNKKIIIVVFSILFYACNKKELLFKNPTSQETGLVFENTITPTDDLKPKMLHNDSGKFECIFTAVSIEKSNSIMLEGLEGSTLGIWAAHGEGKFSFPKE